MSAPATPSAFCPPPKHNPTTVTNQSVAAVVTPRIVSPRFSMTPRDVTAQYAQRQTHEIQDAGVLPTLFISQFA